MGFRGSPVQIRSSRLDIKKGFSTAYVERPFAISLRTKKLSKHGVSSTSTANPVAEPPVLPILFPVVRQEHKRIYCHGICGECKRSDCCSIICVASPSTDPFPPRYPKHTEPSVLMDMGLDDVV